MLLLFLCYFFCAVTPLFISGAQAQLVKMQFPPELAGTRLNCGSRASAREMNKYCFELVPADKQRDDSWGKMGFRLARGLLNHPVYI